MIELARSSLKRAARPLGLIPMQRVFRELQHRNVNLADRRVLDVFAGTGERTIRYYAPLVGHIEAWDIDESRIAELHATYPAVDARVVDSYREIQQTQERYDLVIADNHVSPVEHFALFPHVLRVLSEDSVLVLIVLPAAGPHEEHLANRRTFYGTDTPEFVSIDEMAARYGDMARDEGLRLAWHSYVPRRDMRGVLPVNAGYGLMTLKFEP